MNKPHKAPCCNCKNRKLKCHSKCEKYQEWKAMLNDYNKWLKEKSYGEFIINNPSISKGGQW